MKKFIGTVKIFGQHLLLPFDVVSLSIIENITSTHHMTLSCKNFAKTIKTILENNFGQYKKTFYLQVDVCTMYAPISWSVAQLVKEFLEENVI